jgi:phosphoglycolate phosphatase
VTGPASPELEPNELAPSWNVTYFPPVPNFAIALIDFDGTLVATRQAVVECARQTLIAEGFAVPTTDAVRAVVASGVSLAQACAQLVPGLLPHQIDACVRRYRELYPAIDLACSQPYEGVGTTLDRLAQLGVAVVLLSNKGRAAIEAALIRYGWTERVHRILADEPGLPTKPDPEVFSQRIEPAFGQRPRSDYLMVGDTAADLQFARAVDIRSCWANYGYGDPAACRLLTPDHEIASVAELVAIAGG